MSKTALSTTDWAVLAVLAEAKNHGFGIASLFAEGGELCDIWKLQRTQVYRALEHLEDLTLIKAGQVEQGLTPRTPYIITPKGKQWLEQWLAEPVRQLRYGRSDLRLKIAFYMRQGRDLKPFLEQQATLFNEFQNQFEKELSGLKGIARMSLLWRLHMARAGLAFIKDLT